MPGYRHLLAVALALALALYVTVFARQTYNTYDLPTLIDVTEWPVTLLFLATAWAAWVRAERRAALLAVTGMLAFFGVQHRHLFEVPLGFTLVIGLTLALVFALPPRSR